MTRRRPPLLLVIALLCAFSSPAAARRGERRTWHLAVEGSTDFPLDAGGRLSLELPLRLRLGTSFGVIPDGYVDAVNGLLVAAGGYSEDTGEIVSAALESSFIWRLAAGWRPLPEHGFYFEVGYALATLGAGVDGRTLYDAALTIDVPGGGQDNEFILRRYRIDSMLHLLTAEVGWEWVFADAWVVRVGAGMVATIAAGTEMGYRAQRSGPLQHDELSAAYAAWLDDVYTSALFAPTVTVALGLRLY